MQQVQPALPEQVFKTAMPDSLKTNQVDVVVAQSTMAYDKFHFSAKNRPIDQKHLVKLIAAIRRKNLLRDNPIKVDKDGVVIDGQHRLAAAKALGVPIYYQVTANMTIEDAAAINGPVKKWTKNDYMAVYCKEERPEYLKLKEFLQRHPELSLNLAIDLTYYGSWFANIFEDGHYKCNDIDFAEEVTSALSDFAKCVPYAYDAPFVSAVKHLLEYAEYDHQRMVDKLTYTSSMLRKCTNSLDYLKVFETIYNYRTTEKYRARFERLTSNSNRRRPDRIRRNVRLGDNHAQSRND